MIFSSLLHPTVTMMETNTTTTTTVLLDSKTSLRPAPPLGVAKNGYSSITHSVTEEEIAEYWIRKKTEEEEHLLAAIKAAAPEEDYKKIEESDEEGNDDKKDEEDIVDTHNKKDGDCKEIRVGIKDWWTKSKYAYLNQPAVLSMEKPKRRTSSTYTPISFTFYKPPPPRFSSFQVY